MHPEIEGTRSRNEAEDFYNCAKLQCNTGSKIGQ